jgi:ATP-binding cassette subfamily B protein
VGDLSIGALVAFNGLFMNVSWGVTALGETLLPLLAATGGMERIQEFLSEQPGVADADDAQPLPRLAREIAFHDVTFGYADEGACLRDISFTIPHGWSVAFVGQSGAGKSTVLSLLTRFYDPTGGAVTLDGVDLRRVQQASLRSQIGIVFQENVLFNTTIRENIRVGRSGATDEEVVAAASAAEIHEFIMDLPHGYDTPVGERGGRLSGGQRQRIGIARALLRDPTVLVLDEATSALDAATEASLTATLERVARGRTVVTVTHRLSSTVNADRIFVLDRGKLAEQGRHDELLQVDGLYRQLWEKQSGFAVSEDGSRAKVTPERLRAVPVLDDLGEEILAEVARLLVTENVPEHRTVIHEGDAGEKFYIVVRGKVVVTTEDTSGEARQLAVLHDGDHFGEIALLRNVARTATIRTLTPCVFLTMQRGQFLGLLDKAPHLRENLEAAHLRRTAESASAH